MAGGRKYISWRGMALIAVAMLLLFGVGMHFLRSDLEKLQAQDEALKAQVTLLLADLDDLQTQLQRVGTDGYVENAARETYGYIRQGEIIFAFENPELLKGYTEEEYQIILEEMRD